MSDLYLWDRSGPADSEIERLETLLSRYRYRPAGRAPDFSAVIVNKPKSRVWIWAAAACLAVAATSIGHRAYLRNLASTCDIASVSGTITVNGAAIQAPARLKAGDRIEVARDSEARVRVGSIGTIVVDPESLLACVRFERTKRFSLHRGAVQADIVAQPYVFVIDTPSATAYDLGCAYRLDVDQQGNGWLHVTSGLVMLENSTTESLVAAGTTAEIRHGGAPGIPVRTNASESLRWAIAAIGFAESSEKRSAEVQDILSITGKEDVVTLVNLLWRVDPSDRGAVFDRLAAFFPPPPGVTREGIVTGNWSVIRQWWTGLGFGRERKLPCRFYVQ